MKKNIGFIGCGNMASAMIAGIVKSGKLQSKNIIVSNRTFDKLEKIRKEYDIITTIDNTEVSKIADILVLAIKPNMYSSIINQIKTCVKEDVIIVSIAAGISIKTIEDAFEKKIKVIRTMPNTPAMVGSAMSGVCYNSFVTKDELRLVVDIFSSFGNVEVIEEGLMDAFTATAGSSPALVYMFIEALADGAVLNGLPRGQAYKVASQAVLGAAKMVLETGRHPGELKDNVCSPNGTTIEAVSLLEGKGFRGHIIEALKVCIEKSKMLGKI